MLIFPEPVDSISPLEASSFVLLPRPLIAVELVYLPHSGKIYNFQQDFIRKLYRSSFDNCIKMLLYILTRNFRWCADFNHQEVFRGIVHAESSKTFCDLQYFSASQPLDFSGPANSPTRTLLFGLSEKTISECTFRDLSRSLRRSLTARNTAARVCVVETICKHQRCWDSAKAILYSA